MPISVDLAASAPNRSNSWPARSVRCEATIIACQVGFPIRTSRDQRVLSPPPGLSQSATSFIASCCQGIHQTPLSRLIRSRRRRALLRDGGSNRQPVPMPGSEVSTRSGPLGRRTARFSKPRTIPKVRRSSRSVSLTWKDCLWLSYRACAARGQLSPRTPNAADPSVPHSGRTQNVSCFALFTMSVSACRDLAIGQEGSSSDEPANRIAGERGAGGAYRDRTGDLMLAKHALSQLS